MSPPVFRERVRSILVDILTIMLPGGGSLYRLLYELEMVKASSMMVSKWNSWDQ